MAKQRTRSKSIQTPVDLFETLDLSVSSSTNVDELKNAYQDFTKLSRHEQRDILVYAGPARTISIALRGYELPDLKARVLSSAFITDVIDLVDERETPQSLREQLWLMIAQQRSVLLETIELDLESLERSSLPASVLKEWQNTLTKSYELIATKSTRAIRHLFTTPLTQPSLPLSATSW